MQSLAGEWNIFSLNVLLNIDPHFPPTDDIAGTGCGLKDNFVCSKLSVHLIIMPITSQRQAGGEGKGVKA